MKNSFLFFIHFLLVINFSYSQNIQKDQESLHKIEEHLLFNQKDSISAFLSKVSKTTYVASLRRIVNNDNPSYKDYYSFVVNAYNSKGVDFQYVSDFINSNVKIPSNKNKIDLDYVNIKWFQISKLRDDVSLDDASAEQEQIENYVNQFNPENFNVITAKTLLSTHSIVMFLIEGNFVKGKQLCLKSLEIANKQENTRLKIIFTYHLTDFLIEEKKLDEYIEKSEECFNLEKTLTKNTTYYFNNIQHLIDAYIHKGGYNDRVVELLNSLYYDEKYRPFSYSLYAKFIGNLEESSPEYKNILERFKVSNLIEYCEKTTKIGKGVLSSNELYYLLFENAAALEKKGYLKEALAYKQESISLNRKIYSEELSKSLANFKTKQAVKQKDLEIKSEKEQKKIYLITSILVIGLLLVSIFLIFKIKKQSETLKQKNNIINKTLKEKELLVREVHHRVKNNFQIVSSLLELQTKGIEDKKALALANEGKNRVKSMALIHQKLYQNEDGLVNFDEYIRLLVREISVMFASDKKVETVVTSENMFFDVDTAIPLGLIINELITNAYKYAFKEGRENVLEISISKENSNYKLLVKDNGEGIPEGLEVKKAKSLGLRLVGRLVKQLHGSLNVFNNSGAQFEIYFKDAFTRKNID